MRAVDAWSEDYEAGLRLQETRSTGCALAGIAVGIGGLLVLAFGWLLLLALPGILAPPMRCGSRRPPGGEPDGRGRRGPG